VLFRSYLMTTLLGWATIKLYLGRFRARISGKDASMQQIRKELLYSLRSILIFTLLWAAASLDITGHSRLYWQIQEHGWCYLGFSFVLILILHDTFVYWTHRLMHQPLFFYHFHKLYHCSVHSTPFSIYSFDLAEATLHGLFFFLISLLLPLHSAVLGGTLWVSGIANVIGHLGYEPMPQAWLQSLGKLFNTTTHHDLHHTKGGRCNYGLYFRFWDWIMGTEYPDYKAAFLIATQSAIQKNSESVIDKT